MVYLTAVSAAHTIILSMTYLYVRSSYSVGTTYFNPNTKQIQGLCFPMGPTESVFLLFLILMAEIRTYLYPVSQVSDCDFLFYIYFSILPHKFLLLLQLKFFGRSCENSKYQGLEVRILWALRYSEFIFEGHKTKKLCIAVFLLYFAASVQNFKI